MYATLKENQNEYIKHIKTGSSNGNGNRNRRHVVGGILMKAHTIATLFLGFIIGFIGMELYREKQQNKDEATVKVSEFDRMLNAIEWVESKGNADAIGDGGNAIGSFQIWEIYVDDVNRILRLHGDGTRYMNGTRRSRKFSREMVTIYLKHYGGTNRLGREATVQEMAAMHCAGPDGIRQMNEPKVKKYIKKVMDRLDKTR